MSTFFHPSMIYIPEGPLCPERSIAERIKQGLADRLVGLPAALPGDGFSTSPQVCISGEAREVCFRWEFEAGTHKHGGKIVLDLVAAFDDYFGGFFGYVALKPILDGKVTVLHAKPWWHGEIGRMPAGKFSPDRMVEFCASSYRCAVLGTIPAINDACHQVFEVAWRDGVKLEAKPTRQVMNVETFASLVSKGWKGRVGETQDPVLTG